MPKKRRNRHAKVFDKTIGKLTKEQKRMNFLRYNDLNQYKKLISLPPALSEQRRLACIEKRKSAIINDDISMSPYEYEDYGDDSGYASLTCLVSWKSSIWYGINSQKTSRCGFARLVLEVFQTLL